MSLKRLDVAQAAGLLANLGVIAGIVFLAYEIRQNNLYLQEEARNNLFQNRQNGALRRGMNPDIARILYWQETDEPLSELDRRRQADLIMANFLSWQYDYQSVQRGILDSSDLATSGIRTTWENMAGVEEIWARRKMSFDPVFVEWMEENVVNVRE